MFKESIDIPIPLSKVLAHAGDIISSDKLWIVEIFIFFFFRYDLFDFRVDLKFDLRDSHSLLTLSYTKVEFIHFSHDVIEGVLVGCGFFLNLVFVEAKDGHQEIVDILVRHVEYIGLMFEVKVDNLDRNSFTCSISAILTGVISL